MESLCRLPFAVVCLFRMFLEIVHGDAWQVVERRQIRIVSEPCIYRLAPGVEVGRHFSFLAGELDAWLFDAVHRREAFPERRVDIASVGRRGSPREVGRTAWAGARRSVFVSIR